MARPIKRGLDYFPMDVGMLQDLKIQLLIAEQGSKGLMVWMKLLTMIYREGYYLDVSSRGMMTLIANDCPRDISKSEFDEIFLMILDIDLLDNEMYQNHRILTSKAIQRRYQEVKKVNKGYVMMEDYLLIDEEERKRTVRPPNYRNNIVNSEETAVNSEETIVNSEETTSLLGVNPTKEKKRKVNKKKEEEEISDFCEYREDLNMETIEKILQVMSEPSRTRARMLLNEDDQRWNIMDEAPENVKDRTFKLIEALDNVGMRDVKRVSLMVKKSRFGMDSTPIWQHLYKANTSKDIKKKDNYVFTCMMREMKPGTMVEEFVGVE